LEKTKILKMAERDWNASPFDLKIALATNDTIDPALLKPMPIRESHTMLGKSFHL